MSHRKHGVGVLGLLAVIALGVMAFAATAQAVTSKFLIAKKVVSALKATFLMKPFGPATLLVPNPISALSFELNCNRFTVQNAVINSGTDAEVKLIHEECTVLELSAPLAEMPCTVIASAIDSKPNISSSALVLPVELPSGEPAVLAEKISALILFKSGTGCLLPLDSTVTGELCLKIDNNDTVEPLLLSSPVIQAECKERPTLEAETEGKGVKDKLLYNGREASIDGTVHAFLSGAHNGLDLGVSLQ